MFSWLLRCIDSPIPRQLCHNFKFRSVHFPCFIRIIGSSNRLLSRIRIALLAFAAPGSIKFGIAFPIISSTSTLRQDRIFRRLALFRRLLKDLVSTRVLMVGDKESGITMVSITTSIVHGSRKLMGSRRIYFPGRRRILIERVCRAREVCATESASPTLE